MLPTPILHLSIEIFRAESRHAFRHSVPSPSTNANPRLSRGRSDGVAHGLTSLGLIDDGLPMKRAGEVGLGGKAASGAEMGEALLDESTGALDALVRMWREIGWSYWASWWSLFVNRCSANLSARMAFQSAFLDGVSLCGSSSSALLAKV